MADKPNVWHDEEQGFLKELEKQANLMQDMYRKDYVYYHGLAQKFNIPIIAISALNALTAVVLNDFVHQRYVSIINAVLSAGTGVLGSVQLYLKINEKMTNALRASLTMKKLALKISKELTLEPEHRVTEGKTFLNECHSEFVTCVEQGNPVEKRLENYLAYTKKVGEVVMTPRARILSIGEKLKLVGSSSGESSPKDESRFSEVIVM
jgi:hypothetical protein